MRLESRFKRICKRVANTKQTKNKALKRRLFLYNRFYRRKSGRYSILLND